MIYIKRAEKKDAKKLTDIKVHALMRDMQLYYEEKIGLEMVYNVIEDELFLMKRYIVYKIMRNSEIIGRFLLDPYDKGKMRVEDFAIVPEYQGRGYGLQVLQMIEEAYPYVKKWTLSALARKIENQYMYQKAGYKEIERDDTEVKYQKVVSRKNGRLRVVK